MPEVSMKYLASIFVDATDLVPTPQTTIAILKQFEDRGFIPNTFQQISSSSSMPETRLKLVTPSNEWIINFALHRIDVEKHATDLQGENMGALPDFLDTAQDYLRRVLAEFPMKARRLAVVSSRLLEEMAPEALEEVYGNLFQSPMFYEEHPPFEWDWRSVARLNHNIFDLEEALNAISIVKRFEGQVQSGDQVRNFDGVRLDIDINTTPDNRQQRFSQDHISAFHTLVLDLHARLLEEMREFVYE